MKCEKPFGPEKSGGWYFEMFSLFITKQITKYFCFRWCYILYRKPKRKLRPVTCRNKKNRKLPIPYSLSIQISAWRGGGGGGHKEYAQEETNAFSDFQFFHT